VLPDLTKAKHVAKSERLIEQEMRTAYFDTSEFRLWRRGISLRHRIGDGAGSGDLDSKASLSQRGADARSDGTLLVRPSGVGASRGDPP
jgi:hypothetical protein